jgi:hypothetical protein
MADIDKTVPAAASEDRTAGSIGAVIQEIRRKCPNARFVYEDLYTCMFALPMSDIPLFPSNASHSVVVESLPIGVNKKSYQGIR